MIWSITTEPIQASSAGTSGYLQISNGSTRIVDIMEAYAYQNTPSAITGGIIPFELSRISTSNTNQNITTSCIPYDTGNPALPTGLRIDQKTLFVPSGTPLGGCSIYTEEGANLYLSKAYLSMYKPLGLSKPIRIRPGESIGMHLGKEALATAGWLKFSIVFDV